jgi:hypothetical protein
MLNPTIIKHTLLFLALVVATPSFAEGDATMHQVYLAAEAGKFAEAQTMMDKVLSDHPDSAKAHFVEAELLAKQGQFGNANIELNKAEQLQPGLPFVKPESLQQLKGLIASASNHSVPPTMARQALPTNAKDWMPMALLFLGISFIILLVLFLRQLKSNTLPAGHTPGTAPGQPMSPAGPNGAGSVMGQPTAGGMGSGLMGNLATGAALGAGVVAGEALMHHLLDDKGHPANTDSTLSDSSPWGASSNASDNNDMGGTDFGITDTSSWDDNSSDDSSGDWT